VIRRPRQINLHQHLPFAVCHLPFAVCHLPFAICRLSFAIRHLPFVICHSPFIIRHLPFAICHSSFAIRHSSFPMLLYLVRHGLANWPTGAWPGSDAERPLTPEGEQIIRAEGAALARLGLQPELILHSPLVRARQTAGLLAEALGLSDRVHAHELLSPGFDHKALKKLLREHAEREALMLVGHAPDMANVVERITGGAVKLKEGTVAHVKIEKPDEKPEGTLVWLAPAELLITS
jgi:phosphohistidine phosphatase